MKTLHSFLAFALTMLVSFSFVACGGDDPTNEIPPASSVVKVESVSINISSLNLTEGDSQTITVTISPANATNKKYTFSSSNPEVAIVDENGIITAIKAGEATISVTTTDGNKTAICKVTIEAKDIPATSIVLEKDTVIMISENIIHINASINPGNSSNSKLEWSSSDESIATVDTEGNVKAISLGTASIIVSTEDKKISTSCVVIVTENIVFKDNLVKDICVSNWDIDNDGELNYIEASYIKKFDGHFYKTKISSFDELSFFSGITHIEDYAFLGCTMLKSISFPKNLESIGDFAFAAAEKYNDLTANDALDNLIFPESLKSIGNYAFKNYSNLSSVSFPEGLLSIGDFAFALGWPHEKIEGKLKSVVLPSSLRSIGEYAFLNGVLDNLTILKGITTLRETFVQCTLLKEVSIPEGVTTIEGTFRGCERLTKIELPSTLVSIDYAFEGCKRLANIKIPDSVTSMEGAFSFCSNLKEVTIPKGVKGSFVGTFRECSKLTDLTIPDAVNDIMETFAGCTSLTQVNIPKSVVSIGSIAFEGCSSLSTLSLPDNVKMIQESAFSGCSFYDVTLYPSLRVPFLAVLL